MTTTADPRSLVLAGELSDARAARVFATRFLASFGVTGAVDDVLLVVSELVTNAVVHCRPPITLVLSRAPRSVVIAVSDTGPAHGRGPRRPHGDVVVGRSRIVDGLSLSWRAKHTAIGKTIVAHLAVPHSSVSEPSPGLEPG